jgi:hypothetical protein
VIAELSEYGSCPATSKKPAILKGVENFAGAFADAAPEMFDTPITPVASSAPAQRIRAMPFRNPNFNFISYSPQFLERH